MNSRAGQGAEQRPVALPLSPCLYILQHDKKELTLSFASVLKDKAWNTVFLYLAFSIFEALLATGNLLIPGSVRSGQRKPPVCFA